MKVLDIGCGRRKISGADGLDIDPNSEAKIIHDVNKYPFPIESNSYDMIYAKHIIEHIEDPRGLVEEIQRILKYGGKAFIETPHFTNYVSYAEQQHNRHFSLFMFTGICEGLQFAKVEKRITFYKTFRACGIAALANMNQKHYERFWCFMFPAENVVVELTK